MTVAEPQIENERTEEAVRLSVPASLEYVRIVRLTASGVASRLGFDIEEIENLRVALDELASMAIELADRGELEVTFFTTDTELRIEGRAPIADGVDVGVEALTAQILKAVIDDYELVSRDGYAYFSCVTRRPLA
ncbi:MAG: serine/threonine-protein kinase RsbW [Actinomycetota bacterium]|jgi:serine/threonine-protein kinase RsbW|nr:serine/threonine-protein kinase RsbW [Actinomycetota bacterium]MDQ1386099.1 serine/threonine-protein kinase RsbW [Actinomycetota bacterium]